MTNWPLSASWMRPTFPLPHGLAGVVDQMRGDFSYDETQQEPIFFFVGEEEYQQELAKRGFGTVLQERKFGISATMIFENPPAGIAFNPSVVSLPRKCYCGEVL